MALYSNIGYFQRFISKYGVDKSTCLHMFRRPCINLPAGPRLVTKVGLWSCFYNFPATISIITIILYHQSNMKNKSACWFLPKFFIKTFMMELDNFVDSISEHCLKFDNLFSHDLLISITIRCGLELGDRKCVLRGVGTSCHQRGDWSFIRYWISHLKWSQSKLNLSFFN